MTTPGKLLMISDLEGCAEFDTNSPVKVQQTTVLCKTTTFQALSRFLKEKDKNNKVAFMGDYFDKGSDVVNSINEIVKLSEGNPGKVHVILGNRDVNKLRFIYEFNESLKGCPSNTEKLFWPCKDINSIVNQKVVLERMKLILKTTMGAGPPAYDPTDQLGLKINKIGDGFELPKFNENQESYFSYVLLKAFNANVLAQTNSSVEDKDDLQGDDFEFISNCRKLFQMAKIAIYDTDYKVLLSHAGGFTKSGSFILSETQYYEDILTELEKTPITFDNYYQKISQAQQALQTSPTKNNSNKSLTEVLEFHNKLLTDSLKFDDAGLPSSSYILLQAMGLTGSPNYYSFIASCALNGGCKLDFNVNNDLLKKMSESSIDFVASGHQPHCTTVPLIYRQDAVVFIANDTSNGYRPESSTKRLEIKNIPLSYVERIETNKFGCGVCSLNSLGKITTAEDAKKSNEIKALSKDGKTDNYYQDLVKSYNDTNQVKTIDEIKAIVGVNKPFAPLKVLGGKRKSKKLRQQKSKKTKKGKMNNRKTCRHCRGFY
jgi:hypothetical protein